MKGRKVSGRPFRRPYHFVDARLLISATGWKCCKPRVLTFDEFLAIPPCTTGKHYSLHDTPNPEPVHPSTTTQNDPPPPKPMSTTNGALTSAYVPRVPRLPQPAAPAKAPPPPDSESDDASLSVPPNTTCRRRGCNEVSAVKPSSQERDSEECIYHPGQALFHEGSKGWTCCKRRVLEFDEFMKIEGCKRRKRHLFIGSGKKGENEETLSDVRYEKTWSSSTLVAVY